jgi:hypothetical protein
LTVLEVRWVAWAAISIASALLVAGGLIDIDPWFVLSSASVVLDVIGLVRRVSMATVAAEYAAMVGYEELARPP